jgi:N-acetyl-beta-hexosaminidase
MTDWPRWEVSPLTPIMVVERLPDEQVRNVGHFPIPNGGLLRSHDGELAIARARLAQSAPYLAQALEAACHALRSYLYDNASPDLADQIATAGEAVLAAAKGELG